MCKFNVGDIAYSIREGVVTICRSTEGPPYPIAANDENYTEDGKWYPTDLNPTLLTLDEARAKGYDVPKVKKKVTKEIKRWANVYADFSACNDYYTREDADFHVNRKMRIACVELTGTYEIEVEE
jgi:hypothetical protein